MQPTAQLTKEKLETIKANGKVYKLNAGELVRFDTDDTHYYWLDGTYLPGVTSILDQALPTPYGLKKFYQDHTREEAEKIFEDAGDFGTLMHDAFERLLKGEKLDLLNKYPSRRAKDTILSFIDWFNYYKPTNITTEQPIASKKYKYAATLDMTGTINDKFFLIDFKTTGGIYMSHQLQVLAQKQAYYESYGVRVKQLWILRLGTLHKGTNPKDGEMKTTGRGWEFKPVEKKYSIRNFMNIYRTYLTINGGVIPEPQEIFVYPTEVQLFEEIKKKEVK